MSDNLANNHEDIFTNPKGMSIDNKMKQIGKVRLLATLLIK